MVKFLKPGKIVIVLNGRFAGRKAVIVRAFDEGTKEHPFPHALIAGIKEYPREVSRTMSKRRILAKSHVSVFLKFVNYSHLMPTRYGIADLDLKTIVKAETLLKAGAARKQATGAVRKVFQARYMNKDAQSSGVQYLFHKLRF